MADERALRGEKIVTVLGATGQQGSAVATALLGAGWRVRALVRDPSSARSRHLAGAGVETVPGDYADPASLRSAFDGVYGVFSVQPSSGQAGSGVTDEDEVAYGTSVADIAQSAGVAHLVYSSAIAAGETDTGIGHFDSKSRIEAHINDLTIAATIIRPASFMDILLLPGMGLAVGRISFLMAAEQPMQFIAVPDIGSIVAEVFATPEEFRYRTIDLAGDELTGHELAHQLSNAVGRPITYERMSAELLASNELLARLADAVDTGRLAGNADLPALRARFPILHRFGDWLAGLDEAMIANAMQPVEHGVALR